MFLKRCLALAICVLLFIAVFFIFFGINDSRREAGFQQARVKYGMEGNIVLSSDPSLFNGKSLPAPNQPAADSTAAPVDASATPAASNVIIGPVPPPSSPAPAPATDSTNVPAPSAAPDTNSTPAPPSSTEARPRLHPLSMLLFTAYNPATSKGLQAQTPTTQPATPSPTTVVPAAPVAPSATNTSAAGKPAESTVTPSEMETNSASPSSTAPTTNEISSPAIPSSSEPPRALPVGASVIVLGYHRFMASDKTSTNPYYMKQSTFEEEMKYLKDNGYHVVPLSDVVRFVKHEIGLPPNSVAITIDDGFKSAIVYAAPILKKYGYPWTFFVYPDFITVNEGEGAASWNDLLALQADGVDIESHSMTHPFLTHHVQDIKVTEGNKTVKVHRVLTPEEYDAFLTTETAGSKHLLEQKLGKSVTCLAYPYGDYNKQVEEKAIAAGYEAIFTVADNPVHKSTDRYSIGRYVITKPVEKAFASYLRQGALSLVDATPAPGATTNQARPVITATLGYTGNLDPKSIETDVRDFGRVPHDFDPKTSTVHLYLPRDLIQPVNIVNIRVKDADTGQVMVANWHFNYESGAPAAEHPPIAPSVLSTNSEPLTTTPTSSPANETSSVKTKEEKKEESAPKATSTNPAPATSTSAPSIGNTHSSSSKNPASVP